MTPDGAGTRIITVFYDVGRNRIRTRYSQQFKWSKLTQMHILCFLFFCFSLKKGSKVETRGLHQDLDRANKEATKPSNEYEVLLSCRSECASEQFVNMR